MNEKDAELTPRPVRESQSEMTEIVLPNDANPLGALLGGRLMHWIDLAGALAAHRHSRNYVVTASIDHLDFLTPVHVGDLVIFRSTVNRAFHTSMEVGVKVFVENYISGEHKVVSTAYLTFVAVDRHGRHLPVPQVIPETEEEKRRFEDAGRRREHRMTEMARKTSVSSRSQESGVRSQESGVRSRMRVKVAASRWFPFVSIPALFGINSHLET